MRSVSAALILATLLTGCATNTPGTNEVNTDPSTSTNENSGSVTIKAVDVPEDTEYPPGMNVNDQPVVDGAITIQRIASPVDGWVVATLPENGLPGEVVGNASIKEGVFEDFLLPVDEGLGGEILYLLIHADEGIAGEFEFPEGPDLPVRFRGTVFAASMIVESAE